SITAASPRARTSARIATTASSTFSSISRLPPSSAANSASNPVREASSLSIGGLAETLDPVVDLLGAGLERGAVDDEARRNLRDLFDLDQVVRLQRRAGLHQIDDLARQAEARRQFDGAVEHDAFRLDAARREIFSRDLGIFGRDADVAETAEIVAARILLRSRDDEPALADSEIKRCIEFGIVLLHHHVGAGDAKVRRAERDIGRYIKGAHADDVEFVVIGAEAKLPVIGIVERRFELDAGAAGQPDRFLENASLGQRQNQPLVRQHNKLLGLYLMAGFLARGPGLAAIL